MEDIAVRCSRLVDRQTGAVISGEKFSCITLGGKRVGRYMGTPTGPYPIPLGEVRSLWCAFDLPEDVAAGVYTGEIEILPVNAPATTVTINLEVTDNIVQDRGDHEPWRLSRLRWIDSDVGILDRVDPPFTPLVVRGNKISTWGHAVEIGSDGLPSSWMGLGIGSGEARGLHQSG